MEEYEQEGEKAILKHLSTDYKKDRSIIMEKSTIPRYYVVADPNSFYEGETGIGRSVLLEKDELSPVQP